MEIRALSAEDKGGFVRLVSETYTDSGSAMWFNAKPSDEELETLFEQKLELIKHRLLFDYVAVENGRLVGECELASAGEEWKVGIIIGLKHRRGGLGSVLLKRCIEVARENRIKSIIAEVSEDNSNSMLFFITNGFYKDEKREKEVDGKRISCYRMKLMGDSVV